MANQRPNTDEKLRAKSVEDQVKGTINEAVGGARSKLGDLTDNGSEHLKGKAQEIKGKIQQKKGEIEEDLSDRE